MEQPEDRHIVLIEEQRGLFGLITGKDMSVRATRGYENVEYDGDKDHRTIDIKLYGDSETTIWRIHSMQLGQSSIRLELERVKQEKR